MKTVLALFGLSLGLVFGAEIGQIFVPNSATVVANQDAHLLKMSLVNTSATAVTIILLDRSTNCGGSACVLWKADLGALGSPGSMVTWDFGNNKASGGFTWQASTASVVTGWVSWTYNQPNNI